MWGISIIDMSTGDMSMLASTLNSLTGLDYWYSDDWDCNDKFLGCSIIFDDSEEISNEEAIDILREIIAEVDKAKIRFAKYL